MSFRSSFMCHWCRALLRWPVWCRVLRDLVLVAGGAGVGLLGGFMFATTSEMIWGLALITGVGVVTLAAWGLGITMPLVMVKPRDGVHWDMTQMHVPQGSRSAEWP